MPGSQREQALLQRISPRRRGNVLLIDFGCIVEGYRSDMTRTLFVGEVPDEVRGYHDAVREAQQAAIDAIRVGINGQELDAIAPSEVRGITLEESGPRPLTASPREALVL